MTRIVLTFVFALGISSHAVAAPITYLFQGIITDQPDGAATPFKGGAWDLLFTFDSTWPENSPGDPLSATYLGPIIGGFFDIRTSTDFYFWTIDPDKPLTNEIQIAAFPTVSFFSVGPGLSGPSVPGLGTPSYLLAQLWDDTGTAFTSDAFPTSLDINDFNRTNLQLTFTGSAPFCCSSLGQITSITRVPEPSTIYLLAMGLALGCPVYLNRRRKNPGGGPAGIVSLNDSHKDSFSGSLFMFGRNRRQKCNSYGMSSMSR